MPIVSVIVESLPGAVVQTGEALAALAGATVYGRKDDQIVTVLEGETLVEVDALMRRISTLASVTGVYPVYAGGGEE